MYEQVARAYGVMQCAQKEIQKKNTQTHTHAHARARRHTQARKRIKMIKKK